MDRIHSRPPLELNVQLHHLDTDTVIASDLPLLLSVLHHLPQHSNNFASIVLLDQTLLHSTPASTHLPPRQAPSAANTSPLPHHKTSLQPLSQHGDSKEGVAQGSCPLSQYVLKLTHGGHNPRRLWCRQNQLNEPIRLSTPAPPVLHLTSSRSTRNSAPPTKPLSVPTSSPKK